MHEIWEWKELLKDHMCNWAAIYWQNLELDEIVTTFCCSISELYLVWRSALPISSLYIRALQILLSNIPVQLCNMITPAPR